MLHGHRTDILAPELNYIPVHIAGDVALAARVKQTCAIGCGQYTKMIRHHITLDTTTSIAFLSQLNFVPYSQGEAREALSAA